MSEVARLVSLASFLASHPRISLGEAARATHRTPQELLKDMNALMMVGVHPYTPSDYIGYATSGPGENGLITLYSADHFKRPPNFTPQEALALKYALEHYAQAADGPTRRQIDELAAALAESLQGQAARELSRRERGFILPRRTERMREMIGRLARAGEERRVVELEYFSAHRGTLSRRRVHPYRIVESGSHFYLLALCELAGATRHFRVDRIRHAQMLDEVFTEAVPVRSKAGRMEPAMRGRQFETLMVEFSREAGPDVLEEYGQLPDVEVTAKANGRVVLKLPLFNETWAVGFVMSFGEHATILRPQSARDALKRTLEQALKAHQA